MARSVLLPCLVLCVTAGKPSTLVDMGSIPSKVLCGVALQRPRDAGRRVGRTLSPRAVLQGGWTGRRPFYHWFQLGDRGPGGGRVPRTGSVPYRPFAPSRSTPLRHALNTVYIRPAPGCSPSRFTSRSGHSASRCQPAAVFIADEKPRTAAGIDHCPNSCSQMRGRKKRRTEESGAGTPRKLASSSCSF